MGWGFRSAVQITHLFRLANCSPIWSKLYSPAWSRMTRSWPARCVGSVLVFDCSLGSHVHYGHHRSPPRHCRAPSCPFVHALHNYCPMQGCELSYCDIWYCEIVWLWCEYTGFTWIRKTYFSINPRILSIKEPIFSTEWSHTLWCLLLFQQYELTGIHSLSFSHFTSYQEHNFCLYISSYDTCMHISIILPNITTQIGDDLRIAALHSFCVLEELYVWQPVPIVGCHHYN